MLRADEIKKAVADARALRTLLDTEAARLAGFLPALVPNT